MAPIARPQVGRSRRAAGLLLHGLALWAALQILPETLACARYALQVGVGPGIVRNLVLVVGLLALLSTCAAAWIELRRPQGALAALLRRAFVVLVVAWLWAVFPQQDLVGGLAMPELAQALAATLFALSSLAAAALGERWLRSRAVLTKGLTSLAIALVALELVLQVASRVSTRTVFARQLPGSADAVLVSRRLAPGAPHLGGSANSRGYIDDEFGERRGRARRVVSIGDSFSIGVVPHAFHFTTVAEDLLRDTEILNLGAPGIGPEQYRLLLESEGLELAPDLIVVDLFAGNDLERDEPARRDHGPRWMQRREVMLFLVAQRLRAIVRERGRGGLGAEELSQQLGRDVGRGLTAAQLSARLPHLADPQLEPPTYSRERFLELEVKRALQACGPSDADYARLRDELDRLHAAAGAVPLALVVIPDQFQVDDRLWAEVLAAAGEAELERDRFQREVRAWADARGVPLCDLLDDLRAVPPLEDGSPHLFHLRDTHFNARGNRAAGETVARFLAGILPPPAAPEER